MSSRRNFIQQTAMGITSAIAIPAVGNATTNTFNKKSASTSDFQVGIAGYTFLKFNLEQSLAMMKRIGVNQLSLKDFHLAQNSAQEQINTVMNTCKNAGVNVYALGVIYMKTKEAVDTAFAYAQKTGVSMIVGVPNYDLINYTEEVVKKTGIKLAIHNHGPEDALYPAPKDVYDRIKNLDAGMGMCIDIGHSMRAGSAPEKAIRDYKSRLFDLHIKDVSLAAKEGKAIEIGRGVIDFPEVVESLKKINFKGVCSIEFEKDMSDPLPGMAESIGYFKGVMAAED
jgi:sugar phosphate isomerase/epimerase